MRNPGPARGAAELLPAASLRDLAKIAWRQRWSIVLIVFASIVITSAGCT
jgi:hypothetical protein